MYVRLSNDRGEVADSPTLESLFPLSQANGETWLEDEIPGLGLPGLCLHICGLNERMDLLTADKTLICIDSEFYPVGDNLYLLKWFCALGPIVGYNFSPSEYLVMKNELMMLCEQKQVVR